MESGKRTSPHLGDLAEKQNSGKRWMGQKQYNSCLTSERQCTRKDFLSRQPRRRGGNSGLILQLCPQATPGAQPPNPYTVPKQESAFVLQSSLRILSHSIFAVTLQSRYCDQSHFTDEEAQRG